MFALHLTVFLIAAALAGFGGVLGLIDHEIPRRQAGALGVPESWTRLTGSLMTLGALGLLAGLAVPLAGTLGAVGLVLYFVAAYLVHFRARDWDLLLCTVYFLASVAALAVHLARHGMPGAWSL
ncbi:DoxX family protein [Streptomyces sp. NPDC048172]|uniref:DoxX family protein n=1 Tax=Streptomyces sp. NPDC048172 TaxID=3365505 RepID=UPI00371A3A04